MYRDRDEAASVREAAMRAEQQVAEWRARGPRPPMYGQLCTVCHEPITPERPSTATIIRGGPDDRLHASDCAQVQHERDERGRQLEEREKSYHAWLVARTVAECGMPL
jgi:hypothetical protein